MTGSKTYMFYHIKKYEITRRKHFASLTVIFCINQGCQNKAFHYIFNPTKCVTNFTFIKQKKIVKIDCEYFTYGIKNSCYIQ